MKTIYRDFCKMKQFNVKKLFLTKACQHVFHDKYLYILHFTSLHSLRQMVLAEAVSNTTSNAYFWS